MSTTPAEVTGPSYPDGPVTGALIASVAKIDSRDAAHADLVAPAVNELVRGLPIAQGLVDGDKWPSRVVLGAAMLGARLVRRRNSPAGVEAVTEQGAVYVQRNDPDVAQLLGLGRHQKPAVG